MMLSQFQACYPSGGLISELLTIYQGKFVVRVVVQIDGVTRATGMAAAETPEEAEDKARNRAIAVLIIDQPASPLPATTLTQPMSEVMSESSLPKAFSPAEQHQPSYLTEPLPQGNDASFSLPTPEPKPAPLESVGLKGKTKRSPANQLALAEETFEDFEMFSAPKTENSASLTPSVSSDTPLISNNYAAPANASGEAIQSSEPVDLSDVIAKTDVELERIGWSKKDGKDYLLSTYGKPGRTLLKEQELLEFLSYLESQPSKHK